MVPFWLRIPRTAKGTSSTTVTTAITAGRLATSRPAAIQNRSLEAPAWRSGWAGHHIAGPTTAISAGMNVMPHSSITAIATATLGPTERKRSRPANAITPVATMTVSALAEIADPMRVSAITSASRCGIPRSSSSR